MSYKGNTPHRYNSHSGGGAHSHPQPHSQPSSQHPSQQYSTYYPAGSHDSGQKHQMPMRRAPSYQTGDDATLFDETTGGESIHGGRYPNNGGSSGRGSQVNNLGSRRSQFSVDSSQHSVRSQASSHGSSAMSAYQHQYQSPTSASPSQQAYNPQQFVQPSQSAQQQPGYNPQSFTATGNTQYNQSFQTYNPAAYQSSPPTSSYQSTPGSHWQSTTPVQSYNSSPQTQHQASHSQTSTQGPASNRHYEMYNNGYNSLGYSSNTSQETVASPTVASSTYSPLPPPPPPPPPPASSTNYGMDAPNEHFDRSSLSNRYAHTSQIPQDQSYLPSPPLHNAVSSESSSQPSPYRSPDEQYYFSSMAATTPSSVQPLSTSSAPPPPAHQNVQPFPRRTDTLNRHPQSRPLPGPPSESECGPEHTNDLLNGRGETDLSYDDIMKEVEAAVMEGRPPSTRRHNSRANRMQSQQPVIQESDDLSANMASSPDGMQTHTNGGNINSADERQYADSKTYSDDSDVEAAAGLAALRMAEEEEAAMRARRNTHTSTASSYGYQPQEPDPPSSSVLPCESSSDSDYAQIDMELYGGGYDAHMHYGDNPNLTPSNDQLATSGSLRSSDKSTNGRGPNSHIYDYPSIDQDSIHPFPPLASAARVDNIGTGGLSQPSQHQRRMSFDNGDETALRGRVSQSMSISETTEEGEPQDLFFHPGMSSRPLPPPPVPSGTQNLMPHLMPAGTYRSNEQTGQMAYDQYGQPSYSTSPDGFVQPHVAPPVPRSTSLSDHTSTQRADLIIRSKTDAERARPKPSEHDSSISSPSVTLDLPVLPSGKRKKFKPSKFSTEQFNKCKEPWALSAIVSWIKDLGEDETDLKEQTIVDAIVALFTHKVPTMNTADAETLGERVVKGMFEAGALIQDEEWVKFGSESLSGVLWQITGRGCYSSRLHVGELDRFGRCYSHQCMRTLKKINLQSQMMAPQNKTEDWATFYNIGKEVFDTHSRKEIDRQNNLHEIVTTEDSYIAQLDVLRKLYRDQLGSYQPPVIDPKRLDRFLRDVFGKVDAVKKVNEEYLLAQLKYCQKEQGPFISGFSDIFREWIRKAKSAYIDYAGTFPNANYLVRREAETNMNFRLFLNQARENKLSNRLSWDTYLKAPITRIQRYTLLLSTVYKNMVKDSEEKTNLLQAIEEIKLVALDCDNKVGEMTKKVDLKELGLKLQLRPEMKRIVELNLEHLGREIIHQGDLQRPRTKRFNWVDTRVILFDHYLVLAKVVTSRDTGRTVKYETYDVSKLPIPMDLLVLASTNDDPVVKSGVNRITPIAPNSRASGPGGLNHVGTSNSANSMSSTTVLDGGKDDKIMYPFKIKHLGKRDVFTLYAPTAQCRQEWCEKILEAKTKHAASLYAQNAEPFRLRVLSDSAFAYSDQALAHKGAIIKGTPLDRAIREVETKYKGNLARPLPICRASVNCATVFRQPQGRMMCAVGTDYGLYISAYDDPRGWYKAVNMTRVTQIAVFEGFNLFLLIADKSLIGYHLDSVCPVNGAPQNDSQRRAPQKLSGNREVGFFAAGRMKDRALVFYKKRDGISSTFKVLEPVLQKTSRSRIIPRRGQTQFFRDYDEFYIPADSYSINLFHTSLAISTSRGVEVLTLDKKQPWSVPNLRSEQPEVQAHLSSIANRLKELRPLGMFRLSESEFLVAFQECAVYVNKHGDISRSVVMEFVGHAHSACLCGKFLLLFNEDFVEVRNAMNGRLRQVIAGRNVTLLDDGGAGASAIGGADNPATNPDVSNGLGISTGFGAVARTVKVCMQHPEFERSQIVLELVENEGQKD